MHLPAPPYTPAPQDLQSGLNLARRGGVVFVEEGDYSTDTWWDVRQVCLHLPLDLYLHLYIYLHLQVGEREVVVVGASTSTCSIRGSVRVEAQGAGVTFRRLKIEVPPLDRPV